MQLAKYKKTLQRNNKKSEQNSFCIYIQAYFTYFLSKLFILTNKVLVLIFNYYILNLIGEITMFIFMIVALLLQLETNDIKFQQLTIRDGLSQSSVNTILQDRYGFLWIGTQDKLNRFDGYTFEKFYNIPFDSTTISHNWVTTLHEDNSGKLWVGTVGGLDLFNHETKCFTSIKANGVNLQNITNILSVNETVIINTGVQQKNRYLTPSYSVKEVNGEYHVKELFKKDSLWRTWGFQEIDDKLWFYSEKHKGLLEYDIAKDGIIKIHKTPFLQPSVYLDKEKNLWYSYIELKTKRMGLYKYDRSLQQGQIFLYPNEYPEHKSYSIPKIIENGDFIWAAMDNGIITFNKSTEQFLRHTKLLDPSKHSNITIYNLYKSNTGVIWGGTSTSGLLYHNPYRSGFKNIVLENYHKKANNKSVVWRVTSDKENNLWFSTTGPYF